MLPAAKTVTPAVPGEKTETPDDLLRRTLRISTWTPALTLVYFHTPHAQVDKTPLAGMAAASLRQCKALYSEQVVRWLAVYHPVEVDMSKSDLKTAERLGYKDGALFAVIDQNLNVLATSKPIEAPEGVQTFLKTTIKSEPCKSFWATVQQQIDEQKAALDRARALAKQDKWKEAAEEYKSVVSSPVRVADFYNDAVKEADKANRKADQAK